MPIPPVTPIPQIAPAICAEHTLCFEYAKGLPAAVVALLAAFIAATIAFRQYRVAKAKLNLDLFERRYELFDLVWDYASHVSHNGVGWLHGEQRIDLANTQPKIQFLFGPEIADYVHEILENSASLWTIEQATAANNGVTPPNLVERHTELTRWFTFEAASGVREKFGRYLDFQKWR
ncbi:hypothetical protein [Burkholderia glumae]|uniref:Uncharacterized protein n=1 Tax=Burkholderia glumae TaxID=337 RepID=A0AAQ0BSC7_BURGL|nr:hypothetical protein [Burkholderia glumae]AJY67697.1 hypothetical protein KS03_893 [Burkholderia glumae LMG 2196 = ATCC 33617]PNL00133.1 hypothetical protein CEQ24_013280 [Burkholderia glumae]QJP73097.1 hypothetical protein HJC54_23880 [Burkholderia glumae]QPQ92033.1 hypothetical protein I6H06_23320 [Burkholderia glumae]QQM89755.1 hypothetical protein I6G78_11315 [Burkholderia glumae]